MEMMELLSEIGIATAPSDHDHSRRGWQNFDCPYCSRDWGHYRMGYNERGRYVNCWACGRHDLAQSLSLASGRPLPEIRKLLKEANFTYTKQDEVQPGGLKLPEDLTPLNKLPAHIKYLKERGFDWEDLVTKWEIKGIGLAAEYAWRIFIPIHNNGRMVSWTTRSISDDHKDRYISAGKNQESVFHKSLLYGADYCRHTVILCEGPTDVWAIGPGAVCSFGTSYSRAQLEKISHYPRRVICFDSERAAQKRAKDICSSLEVFDGETYNVRLSCKDAAVTMKENPDEITEIRERFLK